MTWEPFRRFEFRDAVPFDEGEVFEHVGVVEPLAQGNGGVLFRVEHFGGADLQEYPAVGFAQGLGVNVSHPDVGQVEHRQDRIAHHGPDADHRGVHPVQLQGLHGLQPCPPR